MAHMWVRDDSGEWASMQLVGDALALTGDRLELVQQRASDLSNDSAQLQRRKDADGNGSCSLPRKIIGTSTACRFARACASCGTATSSVSASGERMFFSTESLASGEPFTGLDHPIFCPRCKQEIAGQNLAVRCPQCDAWHHQTEEFPCWTYARDARCAIRRRASMLAIAGPRTFVKEVP